MPTIDYRIDATQASPRELEVTVEFDLEPLPGSANDSARRVVLFLPTWTPGSYLIREYARHLGTVRAVDATTGAEVPCRKVGKNRFELLLTTSVQRVRATYAVYAHELSVRTADLTAEHAFWNHACILLWPVGAPHLSARIAVDHPADWALACSLPQTSSEPDAERRSVRRTVLLATNLDAAMDAPCLVGRFQRQDWSIDGVPHGVVLDGLAGIVARPTLVADLTRVVHSARAVFGGDLPYASYLFLCLFTAEGHGGLEHTDSTTLLASRTAFASDKGYREFLSLAAHELFHAWNVKRMRPAEFWTYDYEQENYTQFLWLIEGWTAYYDDLLCQRAGFTTREEYLALLAKSMQAMLTAPGRHRLSLRESSFDAWIRLYRPDENTRNSSQNYYVNGSIAALCLDLAIRRATNGDRCLDDVIREIYRVTFAAGRGYTLADVHACLTRIAGESTVYVLERLVAGGLDPDLPATMTSVGVRVVVRDSERPHLGITFESGGTRIGAVSRGSPAHTAGLAPGDEILALQDLRVDAARWQEVLDATGRVDQPLTVLLARRGVVSRCTVTPQRGPGTLALELEPAPDAQQRRLLDGWLAPSAKT